MSETSIKKTKDDKLEKELKQTFPASDTPVAVQPKKEGAGAPGDRKSVNSGMEQKLAEELELNKRPQEKAV
jgi:hypothetical protein